MHKFKEILYNYWKFLILIIICLLFLGGVIYYYYFYEKDDSSDEDLTFSPSLEVSDLESEEVLYEDDLAFTINYLYVDVKGEVNSPGIYKMEEGSRVIDAINLAGGLTGNANTKVNNLSMKVFDEMVIIIYSNEEVLDFIKTKELEKEENDGCINKDGVVNDSCITSDSNLQSLVNINTASKEELQKIVGIGEVRALAIIEYRENTGLFKDVSDLLNVTGIGDALYDQIKEFVTT